METKKDNIFYRDTLGKKIEPVVGWLVCIKGLMRGQDYRLLSGFNRIGSRASDDIQIFDNKMEREKEAASLVYDGRSGSMYLVAKEDAPVFLNGKQAEEITVLHSEDLLRIYDTEYMLVLFCPDKYKWENEDE